VHHVFAWQVVGERLAIGLGGIARTGNGRCDRGGGFRLGLFESELQLVSLAGQALGQATERHAPKLRHLHAKLLQLHIDRNEHGLDEAYIVGQRGGVQQHDRLYQNGAAHARRNGAKPCSLRSQRWLRRADRMPPVDPFEQHRQLCRREHGDAVGGRRPGEPATLQPLGAEHQTLTV